MICFNPSNAILQARVSSSNSIPVAAEADEGSYTGLERPGPICPGISSAHGVVLRMVPTLGQADLRAVAHGRKNYRAAGARASPWGYQVDGAEADILHRYAKLFRGISL